MSKHTTEHHIAHVPINRRQFLRMLGLGAAAGLVTACRSTLPTASTPQSGPTLPASSPTTPPLATRPAQSSAAETVIALRAHPDDVSILPGRPTRVWRYSAEVVEGSPAHLSPAPGYLGPTFRFQRGERVTITFTNEIPDESIVHWHGMHVPPEMDGHPRFAVGEGETYEYSFEIRNRAGTYWYHPHPHGRTGPQVYYGMAGFFIVHDEEEERLDLPRGDYEIPLVIQDRLFDADNQLIYQNGGMGMDPMLGFLGDTILVNGTPDASFAVATRPYRLRILNGSNSRIYRLAWSDNNHLIVIGTDGGLLERPVKRPFITLGPAERVDLWVDFSHHPVGSELILQSLPVSGQLGSMGAMGGGMGPNRGMMRGGMGMGMGRGAPAQVGAQGVIPIARFRIEREEKSEQRLPETLSRIERLQPTDAVNRDNPRRFVLSMRPMQGWSINGRTFRMTDVAKDERVRRETVEIWQFENQSNGGGMGMMGMALPHPMHIHDIQFQVIGREMLDPAMKSFWEEVRDGFIDEGWKDTVLVMPGERVTLITRFGDYEGMYLYHCHNLEHEDMGMMRNFLVEA
nr:multicopper oxidase domain-containing protein [Ardenticatena sp.]